MRRAFQESDLIQPVLLIIALVTAIGLGLLIISMIRKALHPAEARDEGGELLETLQEAYAAGEIDEAEYRRAREALTRATGAPPPLPATPAITEGTADPPSAPS